MLSLKHRRNFPRLPWGFPVSPLPHSLLRWKACGKSRETQVALTNIIFLFLLDNKGPILMCNEIVGYKSRVLKSTRRIAELILINTKGNRNVHQHIRPFASHSAESFVNRSRAGSVFAWKEDWYKIPMPHVIRVGSFDCSHHKLFQSVSTKI